MPEIDNDRVDVKPGTLDFEKMVFKLSNSVNEGNIDRLSFNGYIPNKVQNEVFAMPALMSRDLNLFFLISKLIGNDWIIAFSKATVENEIDVKDLSEPLTTGEGLNQLGIEDANVANQILDYFAKLINDDIGEWKMIK